MSSDDDTLGYPTQVHDNEKEYLHPTPTNSPLPLDTSSPKKLADQSMIASDEDLYKYAEAMEYLENVSDAANFLINAPTPKISKRDFLQYNEDQQEIKAPKSIKKKLNFENFNRYITGKKETLGTPV